MQTRGYQWFFAPTSLCVFLVGRKSHPCFLPPCPKVTCQDGTSMMQEVLQYFPPPYWTPTHFLWSQTLLRHKILLDPNLVGPNVLLSQHFIWNPQLFGTQIFFDLSPYFFFNEHCFGLKKMLDQQFLGSKFVWTQNCLDSKQIWTNHIKFWGPHFFQTQVFSDPIFDFTKQISVPRLRYFELKCCLEN